MYEHAFKTLEIGHRRADIDLGLLNIITLCWRNDIDTTMCCENNIHGFCWLMMPHDSAIKFRLCVMDLIKPHYGIQNIPKKPSSKFWHITCDFYYKGAFGYDKDTFGIHFRFPPKHIIEIEKCLERL